MKNGFFGRGGPYERLTASIMEQADVLLAAIVLLIFLGIGLGALYFFTERKRRLAERDRFIPETEKNLVAIGISVFHLLAFILLAYLDIMPGIAIVSYLLGGLYFQIVYHPELLFDGGYRRAKRVKNQELAELAESFDSSALTQALAQGSIESGDITTEGLASGRQELGESDSIMAIPSEAFTPPDEDDSNEDRSNSLSALVIDFGDDESGEELSVMEEDPSDEVVPIAEARDTMRESQRMRAEEMRHTFDTREIDALSIAPKNPLQLFDTFPTVKLTLDPFPAELFFQPVVKINPDKDQGESVSDSTIYRLNDFLSSAVDEEEKELFSGAAGAEEALSAPLDGPEAEDAVFTSEEALTEEDGNPDEILQGNAEDPVMLEEENTFIPVDDQTIVLPEDDEPEPIEPPTQELSSSEIEEQAKKDAGEDPSKRKDSPMSADELDDIFGEDF